MRALVTGGTGCLGTALVRALSGAGHNCRVVHRGDTQAETLPRSCELARGDLRDLRSLERATEGVDVVFHLAAAAHRVVSAEEATAVNVAGTENILRAARDAGVSKVVFFSTQSVCGVDTATLLRETCPPRPLTPYSCSKAEAEALVLAARWASPVVLRLPVAYGVLDRGNIARLILAVAKGRFIQFGDGGHSRPMVDARRAAAAALRAAVSPAAGGQVIHVADDPHPTLEMLLDAIRSALGKDGKGLRLPRFVGTVAARMGDGLERLGIAVPFNQRVFQKVFCPLTLDLSRARQLLGLEAGGDLPGGIAQEVHWLRREGLLRPATKGTP